MWPHCSQTVLAVLFSTVQAIQIPFITSHPNTSISPQSSWADFGAVPDPNWTGHLIFDTVNSLSQHWPNTRYRNGHNIVPGIVPVEWTATDPEHAFLWCGGLPVNGSLAGCWQLTVVVMRPLKVLYFDGSSGARISEGGPSDTQDLLIWGKVDPARSTDERARINDLSSWGEEFGIDGYVRMTMDFEIMLCDFSRGIKLLAADYLAAWTEAYRPPQLFNNADRNEDPNSSPQPPFQADKLKKMQIVSASSWHNHYPGETRVLLDLAHSVSFYDTNLASSLVAYRIGKERWDHRAYEISSADLAAVKTRLREVLGSEIERGSGIDWQTLYRVVVDRYADRLETLQHLLDTTTAGNLRERAPIIQTQLRAIITPYILYNARPTLPATMVPNYAWVQPVWYACATKHTAYIHKSATLRSRLTSSEHLLLDAVDGTNREICRVLVRMWAAGVHAGIDPLLSHEGYSTLSHLSLIESWRADTQALMVWLDWSVWVKCRPACPVEEMCYLPTWPFFWVQWTTPEGSDDLWKRPQPRCIRRFEPFSRL
ncbi:hypothetical protein C8R47DRAFT_1322488 [Mycena vitilis]|nr:hypothetical protein C8R47DRAFT_1322488 [Mycena vitilis]